MFPGGENMIVVPITKKIEIIISIKVWPVSRLNIKYKENGGKKGFLGNPKHQYHVSQRGEHDFSADNKKNGDYYEYPSLSQFLDEL